MKKVLGHPIVILIARFILGYIFITFGASKIAEPSKFANEISNYAIMPDFSLNFLAIIIPWIEVVTGILLVLGLKLKSNAAITGSLMLVFIIAIVWALANGLDINCGCSSANPVKIGFPKLMENTGLFLLSLIIYLFPSSKFSLGSINNT